MTFIHEMSIEITAEKQEIASSIEQQTAPTSEVTRNATNLNKQVKKLTDTVAKFTL